MKNLKHANIVRLFAYNTKAKYHQCDDNGTECHIILLVMEYMSGGELFDILYYTNGLPEILAGTYFHQLMFGVETLHSRQIDHRDLKPQNLPLDTKYIFKVSDFGLSKIMQLSDEGMMRLYRVGTNEYQAPEIILNKPYTSSYDIFVCGVILFLLSDGKVKKFWKQRSGCGLKPYAIDLVTRMLAFDPNENINDNHNEDEADRIETTTTAESSIHYGAASTFYCASKMNIFEDSVDHSLTFSHISPKNKNKNKNTNNKIANKTIKLNTNNRASKNIKFASTTSVTNDDCDERENIQTVDWISSASPTDLSNRGTLRLQSSLGLGLSMGILNEQNEHNDNDDTNNMLVNIEQEIQKNIHMVMVKKGKEKETGRVKIKIRIRTNTNHEEMFVVITEVMVHMYQVTNDDSKESTNTEEKLFVPQSLSREDGIGIFDVFTTYAAHQMLTCVREFRQEQFSFHPVIEKKECSLITRTAFQSTLSTISTNKSKREALIIVYKYNEYKCNLVKFTKNNGNHILWRKTFEESMNDVPKYIEKEKLSIIDEQDKNMLKKHNDNSNNNMLFAQTTTADQNE